MSLDHHFQHHAEQKMAQELEKTKGGGGSIRVGATGTISSLMKKELEPSSSSHAPSSSRRTPQTEPVCVSYGDVTFKLRKSIDGVQNSSTSNSIKHRSPENIRRTRGQNQHRIHKRTLKIPMLGSENIALDKTPSREKPSRKVSIVEIVDTNCGSPAGTLSNRLKKLGFSKLSQSVI